MIVEIGITDDPEKVGFYSGLTVNSTLPVPEQSLNFFDAGIRVLRDELHR